MTYGRAITPPAWHEQRNYTPNMPNIFIKVNVLQIVTILLDNTTKVCYNIIIQRDGNFENDEQVQEHERMF